ncbi:putative methyltransferase C9orf114 [Anoplophora glabripennis]|uniref:putative methyltransferase C9orf114 n=1 Tax=Anoplophora glabripennis TaxID=217634 RepID=UPI0008748B3A|nr:putative methyltransferase C9orf114 [Anoplophora glabripennis]
MAPINTEKTKKQKWSDINKIKKEEKKKWKEQNMMRKLNKKKLNVDKTVPEETLETPKIDKISTFISTLSIAVPGSILENAQSHELRTYLAGQIARAACIFQVDEIVVFDDYGDEANSKKSTIEDNGGLITARHSCVQLGRILQYLECPQYLRKSFFPIHNDLKYCGILNPLNAPHHMGPNDQFAYREGVVLNKPVKSGRGSCVNVGLLKDVHVDKSLTPGLRCTVQLLPQQDNSKKLKGIVVSPATPRKETGIYWGYSVRIANSLSKVFSQCPYDGYDLIIGTSDKGTSVDEFNCPKYKHLLIMFGGLQGLEAAIENDPVLQVDDPQLLFDQYLNTLPNQGSKTLRTEEAILVSLAALRSKLNPEGKCAEFKGFSEDVSETVPIDSGDKQVDSGDDMSRFD